MKVVNTLNTVEVNGTNVSELNTAPIVEIKRHWNDRSLVCIKIGDTDYALVASEVIAATQNCTR